MVVAVDISEVDCRTIFGTEMTWLPPPEASTAPETRFSAARDEPDMSMPDASVSAKARRVRDAVRSSATEEVTRNTSAEAAALMSAAAE